MVKTMKYQIIKPIDTSWQEFGKLLFDLRRDTREVMNKSMQLAWEYYQFSSEYKQKHGAYPQNSDVLGYKTLSGYAYDKLKSTSGANLNSGNYSTSSKAAVDKWKSCVKEILKGEMSIPSYKQDLPLDLHNRSYKIIKENGDYYVNLSLTSKEKTKEMGRKSGQFLVLIDRGRGSSIAILDRILSGEYKKASAKIYRKKNKWFINISYNFEPVKVETKPGSIMGVDLGIVYPVYMAFNDSLSRYKIEGGEIERFRRQVESRKIQMLRQSKFCGEGRIGHGRNTRTKPLDIISDKIARFRDTVNHKYSKYVVDMAVNHRVEKIQMEDLSGIGNLSKFLKNWAYYDLQEKIKYKAAEKGIEVVLIDPSYTSQRCSECGYIDRENRQEQAKFICKNCGVAMNADYNAARNIATEGIEEIIRDSKEIPEAG